MMAILLQMLAVAIGGLSLVALVDIALSLRAVRSSYEPRRQAIRIVRDTSARDTSQWNYPKGGDAIWVFREKKWVLEASDCQPGYEPGPPPQSPGAYEGHRVRRKCLPSGKA